jgi:hypothetical protein
MGEAKLAQAASPGTRHQMQGCQTQRIPHLHFETLGTSSEIEEIFHRIVKPLKRPSHLILKLN